MTRMQQKTARGGHEQGIYHRFGGVVKMGDIQPRRARAFRDAAPLLQTGKPTCAADVLAIRMAKLRKREDSGKEVLGAMRMSLSLSGNRRRRRLSSDPGNIRGGGPGQRSGKAHVDRPALPPRQDSAEACEPAVWTGQSCESYSFRVNRQTRNIVSPTMSSSRAGSSRSSRV